MTCWRLPPIGCQQRVTTSAGEYAGKAKTKGAKGTGCTFSVAARQLWDPDVVEISRVNPHHQHGGGGAGQDRDFAELIRGMTDKEFSHAAAIMRAEQDRRFPRKRTASHVRQRPSKRSADNQAEQMEVSEEEEEGRENEENEEEEENEGEEVGEDEDESEDEEVSDES